MKKSSIVSHEWPRAILHVDGDAFFASCEQSVDPKLRGKPVVTGQERGIASAMSYEAKRMGVKRAMSLLEVRKVCPEAIILPSNYELYSLMSLRMYEIVRRYTPIVEEYSIDECFGDLTGLRRPLGMTYPQIAEAVKKDLDHELSMTFSVGVAPTKTLAKVASNFSKPSGCVIISGKDIQQYLESWPVGEVWGVGSQTREFLIGRGINTALDLAELSEGWVEKALSKPFRGVWRELRGEQVHEISTEKKDNYKSIRKTKTFTPPSKDRGRVFAELSKNIENACIKMRRYNLRTSKVSFFLKTQDFHYHGKTFVLDNSVQTPEPLLELADKYFDSFFTKEVEYRTTGAIMRELKSVDSQLDLFGEHVGRVKLEGIHDVVDEIDNKFGKHTVFLGSSLETIVGGSNRGKRGEAPKRWKEKLKGETARKRLNVPMLGDVH